MSDADFGGGSSGGEFAGGHDGHGDNDSITKAATELRSRTGSVSHKGKIEIHVQSHGACDVKRLFIQFARETGMVAIDRYRPNLSAEDRMEKKIMDWDAFSPPDDESIMPSGHYKGATGWTRMWKEFWQIGMRPRAWAFWEPLEPRFSQRTWLEISCVTWCYNELGDLETRLTLEVEPLHTWSTARQRWEIDEYHYDRHFKKAEELSKRLLAYLQKQAPFGYATSVRAQWRKTGEVNPQAPVPVKAEVITNPPPPPPPPVSPVVSAPAAPPPATPARPSGSSPCPTPGSGVDLELILRP